MHVTVFGKQKKMSKYRLPTDFEFDESKKHRKRSPLPRVCVSVQMEIKFQICL